MIDENKKLEIMVIRYTWLTGVIITLILFIINFLFDKNHCAVFPVSYFLGLMVGLMCFNLRIKTLDKGLLEENRPKLKKMLVRRTFINLFLYMIVLALSGFSQFYRSERPLHLNIFFTAFGILTLKIVIYFKSIVIDSIRIKRSKKEGDE